MVFRQLHDDELSLSIVNPPPVPSSLHHRSGLPRWEVMRVIRYMEDNLLQPVRLKDLAAIVNRSRSVGRFAALFRRTVGESPCARLRRRRIERAQELMLVGNESLAQIAVACGLADQSHLTKLFRRLVGTTPARWRSEHCATTNP